MANKIVITSGVSGTISVNIPDLRFSRVWPRKGAKVIMDSERFEEAKYDVGFSNMIKMGMLIVDGDNKPEEEDFNPVQPEGLILTDKERTQYWTILPLEKFKEVVDKLNKTQLNEMVRFAVDNKYNSLEKIAYMKEKTGQDITKLIEVKADSAK